MNPHENVCYTLGTPAELLSWLMWRDKSYQIGPVLFMLGSVFSVMLTLGVALLTFIAFML